MARITVEDCIDKFPSRFELVLIASNRARKLHSGETPTVDKDNDKNTVIALREIANQTIKIDDLKNNLIEEYQTVSLSEDEENVDDNQNREEISGTENNLTDDKVNLEDNESANPNQTELADVNDIQELSSEGENNQIQTSDENENIDNISKETD